MLRYKAWTASSTCNPSIEYNGAWIRNLVEIGTLTLVHRANTSLMSR